MHDFDNTSGSALLHAYLEGDLDSFEEPRLFSMLAEQQELRGELRDYLLIGDLVGEDSDRLLPGTELRAKVWETLGLGMTEAAPSRIVEAVPFWNARVLGVALLSAIMAVLLTIGALTLLNPDALIVSAESARGAGAGNSMSGMAPATGEERSPALSRPIDRAGQPPTTKDLSSADGAHARERAITSRGAGAGVERPAPKSADRLPLAPRNDRVAELNDVADRDLRQTALRETALRETALRETALRETALRSGSRPAREAISYHPSESEPIISEGIMKSPIDDEDDGRRILLQAHGHTASSFPRVETSQPSDPFFNNMSAGIGYALSPRSQVAIEFGEESFTQRYSGVEEGRGVTYTQRPLLLWAGASYRYELQGIELPGGLHPYTKLMAGGTEVGPLFRGALGLSSIPDSRVGFSLGLEGSILPYRFQQRWFTTRKLGVVYGLSLLF